MSFVVGGGGGAGGGGVGAPPPLPPPLPFKLVSAKQKWEVYTVYYEALNKKIEFGCNDTNLGSCQTYLGSWAFSCTFAAYFQNTFS